MITHYKVENGHAIASNSDEYKTEAYKTIQKQLSSNNYCTYITNLSCKHNQLSG